MLCAGSEMGKPCSEPATCGGLGCLAVQGTKVCTCACQGACTGALICASVKDSGFCVPDCARCTPGTKCVDSASSQLKDCVLTP